MEKTIDLSKSVFEICRDHPEMIEVMGELGFENIATPGMLNTAGRFMTIPKGAEMKKISLEHIIEVLKQKGFIVSE